jgi:hypothetical protein
MNSNGKCWQVVEVCNAYQPTIGEASGEGESSIRCGACGLPGHMRTNRNCPLYDEPLLPSEDGDGDSEEESDEDFYDDDEISITAESVKLEGNKIRYSKDAGSSL